MKPISLIQSLDSYRQLWFQRLENPFKEDESVIERFHDLLINGTAPFSRTHFPGHVTGSCFVLDPSRKNILLLKHRKLGKWLQMGGHCDGECEVRAAALREAWEESGNPDIRFLSQEIIDLDIHMIPENPKEPEHLHFDVRYLALCTEPQKIELDENEGTDLKWFSWDEAYKTALEPSMHRVFRKIQMIDQTIGSVSRG